AGLRSSRWLRRTADQLHRRRGAGRRHAREDDRLLTVVEDPYDQRGGSALRVPLRTVVRHDEVAQCDLTVWASVHAGSRHGRDLGGGLSYLAGTAGRDHD